MWCVPFAAMQSRPSRASMETRNKRWRMFALRVCRGMHSTLAGVKVCVFYYIVCKYFIICTFSWWMDRYGFVVGHWRCCCCCCLWGELLFSFFFASLCFALLASSFSLISSKNSIFAYSVQTLGGGGGAACVYVDFIFCIQQKHIVPMHHVLRSGLGFAILFSFCALFFDFVYFCSPFFFYFIPKVSSYAYSHMLFYI